MNPYYSDDSVTLYHGDCLDVLRRLPDASVNACVTSPPYFGLRDYGSDGQHGLEASPAEYVETMRSVFAEVRRVLADDGTLWLNLGDSYSAKRSYQVDQSKAQRSRVDQPYDTTAFVPAKNLMGIPWRVAFALQDDGWLLRNDIIWAKPNAMPESVTDRLSTRHEHLFMFSKARSYWFDLDAVREPAVTGFNGSEFHTGKTGERQLGRASRQPRFGGNKKNGGGTYSGRECEPTGTRNPGDVWTIPTQPFAEAHFAVMAPELARRAIVAGCKPGGTVLDPYSGSGTTGWQATKNGRKYVGIELNADYLDLSLRTRLSQSVLDFGEATA